MGENIVNSLIIICNTNGALLQGHSGDNYN